MSTEKHPLKAPAERAEALLRGWPDAAKGDAYWQAQRNAIEQRLSSTSIGSTPDELLLSALPMQPGEGSLAAAADPAAAEQATSQAKPLSDRPGQGRLVDMARALAQNDRDDLREVAKQGLSLAARSRSSARKHSIARARAARAAPREPHAEEPSSEALALTPEAPRPATTKRQSKRSAAVYASVAAGIIAAAAMMMLVATRPPATAEAISTPSAAEQGRLPASADRESDAEREQARAEQAKSRQPQGASGTTQPAREQKPPSPERQAKVRSPEPSRKQASKASMKPSASPSKPVGKSRSVATEAVSLDETSKDESASQPPRQSDLADKKLVPADAKRLTVSEKPSYGAAIAAVGAVLPSARSCLAGQNQSVPATVVFSSNGRVQSVSTEGPLAGSPAASCIAARLKRARVQPFARSTFSISISVRPP